jgi:hypothetical protein
MKTAVEWYSEQLKAKLGRIVINQDWKLFDEIIQDAMSIEKLQISDAWENGFSNGYDLGKFNDDCKPDDADEYYNETFGETIVTEYRDGSIKIETFKQNDK